MHSVDFYHINFMYKGLISIESPLGKSLLGKELDDIAKVKLPSGMKEFEIRELSVEYEDLEEKAS